MTPERLEIARRFVARKGWVFLPGMREASGDRIVAVDNREACLAEEGAACDDNHASWVSQDDCIPDLADDLTRIGLLAVVRRAHRDESIGIVRMSDGWSVTAGVITDRWIRVIVGGAPSEEAALLAALEAAQ